MKKLLIVATIPDTLSAFFTYITRHLQANGWVVDGMAAGVSNDTECLELFDNVWDVDLSRNPLAPKNLLTTPQQIKDAVKKNDYDIVNVTTPVAAFVTRLALKNARKQRKLKVIYTAQGFHFYKGGALHRNAIFFNLEKIAAPGTDYLVVVNREDAEAAKKHKFVADERVRLIPGTGLNLKRFDCNSITNDQILQVRQELGLTTQTHLFLSVAEFIERKHHKDILEAFALLNRQDVHLALAGDGILLEQMQQLAVDLGIQDKVDFLGFRRDIPVLIRASLATILASEQEGLPNCVMESLCMETPVIGSNIRGTRDLLEDGYGLLFETGDVKGLAKAMSYFSDNPQEAFSMGKKGRKSLSYYDVPSILQKYEALYTEALSSKSKQINEYSTQNS